jgi:hypothetical protein
MKGEKTQVFYIHGGITFKNKNDYLNYPKTRDIRIEEKKKWSGEYLEENLGKNFR